MIVQNVGVKCYVISKVDRYEVRLHPEGETVPSIDLEFSFHSCPVRTEVTAAQFVGSMNIDDLPTS